MNQQQFGQRRSWSAIVVALLTIVALAICAFGTVDAAVPAGSSVTNVAKLRIGDGAGIDSNPVATVIDELLDIGLMARASSLSQQGAYRVLPFALTNLGNGHEAFLLSGTIDGAKNGFLGFARDVDGDGRYDPAIDMPIPDGGATIALDPAAAIRLFALVDGAMLTGDMLAIRAHAVTGSGEPGTVFPAKGDGGSDAIVGKTTASAMLEITLTAGTGGGKGPTVKLVKAQAVTAPDGSDRPVHGAVITYTLTAKFEGSGDSQDAALHDPIPNGTDYVPGSLTLEGARLTDATNDDAGSFDGSAVAVALGDVAAPATRTILFQVKIK